MAANPSPIRLSCLPVVIFEELLLFLHPSQHGHLATTSSVFQQRVRESDQKALFRFRLTMAPAAHDDLFSNNYVQNLTTCLKRRPTVLQLGVSEVQSVYWANCYISRHLLSMNPGPRSPQVAVQAPLDDASVHLPATSSQLPSRGSSKPSTPSTGPSCIPSVHAPTDDPTTPPISANGSWSSNARTRVTLDQSFDLICSSLLRAHSAHQNPEHCPTLMAPHVEKRYPDFHVDMLNVLVQSLRFIHGRPECRHLWKQVKETLTTLIPERIHSPSSQARKKCTHSPVTHLQVWTNTRI